MCMFIFHFGQVLTAVAFSLFAQESVDIAVIEVADLILTPLVLHLYYFSCLFPFVTNMSVFKLVV